MIVEGGRLNCHWGFQCSQVIFSWLVAVRDILYPKSERRLINLVFLFFTLVLALNPAEAQNCDVDFPGTSSQTYSVACGGISNGLNLGKNIYFDDFDNFTFDAPAIINVQGNLTVTAQGNGTIIIPAGVTVIVDGNMQLNDQNGGCEGGNPCTFTVVVNGYLQITGSFQNSLNSLVWEGTGTVEVQEKLENSSDGCMTCGLLSCPSFPAGSGGCQDNGCILDFCLLNYGVICLSDLEKPIILNCPSDIEITTLPGSCEAQVSWKPPNATDNCNIAGFTSSHEPGDSFPLGETMVTYTAIDQSGNSASCSFKVSVEDQQPPLFTNCPGDIKVTGLDPDDNLATVNWPEPIVSDNCVLSSLTSSHQPGSKFPLGTTMVIYTAVDEAGNQQTCSFTIEISVEVLLEEIEVYKAFSPNGDGINDLWIIGRIGQHPENSVVIFDRWGSIIYEAEGYNNENIVWNGSGNSNRWSARDIAPAGTYYYNIKIHGSGSVKGYVELIK